MVSVNRHVALIFCVLTCGSSHLHSHQSSDQDRQIKLAGDTFGDRRVAGLQSQWSDVAKSDGGQRRQAEVAENRKNVLNIGRVAEVLRPRGRQRIPDAVEI